MLKMKTTSPFNERLRVVIDTREQTPWNFQREFAECSRGTLPTGDYALAGDMGFAIERKSLDDFLGTVSTGWERFRRELARMEEARFPAKVIIVEADYCRCQFRATEGGIIPPDHNHPMLLPQFVNKRIAELTMMQVSVLLAGDCHIAAALAFSILKERYLQL